MYNFFDLCLDFFSPLVDWLKFYYSFDPILFYLILLGLGLVVVLFFRFFLWIFSIIKEKRIKLDK